MDKRDSGTFIDGDAVDIVIENRPVPGVPAISYEFAPISGVVLHSD